MFATTRESLPTTADHCRIGNGATFLVAERGFSDLSGGFGSGVFGFLVRWYLHSVSYSAYRRHSLFLFLSVFDLFIIFIYLYYIKLCS